MPDISAIQTRAGYLIEEYAGRNKLFGEFDVMFHGGSRLPGDLESLDWIMPIETSDAHDAIRAGTRVLSTLDPKVTFWPRNPNPENRKRASEIEHNLKWFLINASKRRQVGTVSKLMMSCLMYDTAALQVVHLPYQQKVLATHKIGARAYKNYMRFGPFAIIVHKPENVFPMENDYGLEGVLSVRVEQVHRVLSFWGERANQVEKKSKEAGHPFDTVTVYDYTDLERRVVWAIPGEKDKLAAAEDKEAMVLMDEELGLDFLPWIYRTGSGSLSNKPEEQILPLLYSLARFKQYEVLNTLNTLVYSDAIATIGKPKERITGPHPETAVQEEFDTPQGKQLVQPGHTVVDVAPRQLDVALLQLMDRTADAIGKTTVARILQNADIPAGTAFATINLATQTAVGSLKPYKALGETALADICEQMLLWIRASKMEAVSYGREKADLGTQYFIRPDEIDPENLYIDVELHPDVPTDRLARINGAQLLISMGYSPERAFEEMGVSDPDQAILEGYEHQMVRAMIQQAIQAVIAEKNAKTQQKIQSMMQPPQPQPGQPPGAPPGPPPQMPPGAGPRPPGPPGMRPPGGSPFPGGQGFNPALAGLPPAMANPNGTREMVSGRDRGGNELP